MGWIFAIALMIVSGITGDTAYIIAAGLFAIAGSVSLWASKSNDNDHDERED